MRIFSGIRPSGKLHIGNYLGAISQWIKFQENHECFFCIVDLHAITTPYDPNSLRKNIQETLIVYLAAGLDPKKCTLFLQSKIKEHTELAWILGTICPLGDLKRMTQFKEKAKKEKGKVSAALLNYPLLMAADILIYKAQGVPVGEDQKQHVELTRELARRFNKKFGTLFPEPELILPKKGAKIMSLQEPRKKMSKTDSPKSYIALFDSPKEIKEKIMKAVTDSGKIIKYDPLKKPALSNLLTIYSLFSGKEIKEIEKKFEGKGYAFFKKSLAELLIKKLEPFRKKKKEFEKKEVFLREILSQGEKKAKKMAKETLSQVKQKMGFF